MMTKQFHPKVFQKFHRNVFKIYRSVYEVSQKCLQIFLKIFTKLSKNAKIVSPKGFSKISQKCIQNLQKCLQSFSEMFTNFLQNIHKIIQKCPNSFTQWFFKNFTEIYSKFTEMFTKFLRTVYKFSQKHSQSFPEMPRYFQPKVFQIFTWLIFFSRYTYVKNFNEIFLKFFPPKITIRETKLVSSFIGAYPQHTRWQFHCLHLLGLIL